MVAPSSRFGLSADIIKALQQVFAHYPEIERVVIFGSRAKATFKNNSDIDLAIIAPMLNELGFTRLWNELDALPIIFKMDIVHWDRLNNARLKAKIALEGCRLYPD